MQHCVRHTSADLDGQFVTRHLSVLMTASRLQHALSSGLEVQCWSFSELSLVIPIVESSIEPKDVIALLRLHGLSWGTELCTIAAICKNLALLQWLCYHTCQCPWQEDRVLVHASTLGSVAMLEWLWTVTAPWSTDIKRNMLEWASCDNTLTVVQWLLAHGAVWPESFSSRHDPSRYIYICVLEYSSSAVGASKWLRVASLEV
jgi:hypothetical protein